VRPPKMVRVESTSIELVGYDEDARELYVQFRLRGRMYVYFDVPPEAYAALLEASSKGRYLNFEIKPYYRYRRV
jgi:KTSC domain